MGAEAVVDRARELGVTLRLLDGAHVECRSSSPIPQDLLEELRQHKAEVLAYLARPNVVNAPPQWHAGEIKRCVERDGLCVFWADLFGEPVAFIADEVFREQVPAGVVCYTVGELDMLFGDREAKPSDSALKLIHEGKKLGGRIIGHEGPSNGGG